ncbi:hypothetical protein [Brevundimonas sp.]|uniref:hypothetical protein n=1 Tax=Brevundimonas sp. TaxID=1871086 RepID=UPI00391B7AB4
MKAYINTAYTIVRWVFIIWAIIFLIGGAVFASDILTVPDTPVGWSDVAMSGAMSFASFVGSFFVLAVRRAHNAVMDR